MFIINIKDSLLLEICSTHLMRYYNCMCVHMYVILSIFNIKLHQSLVYYIFSDLYNYHINITNSHKNNHIDTACHIYN